MNTKFCKRCGETKPVDDFYRTKSGKHEGRIATDCKACCSERVMASNRANPEPSRIRSSRYYHQKVKSDPQFATKLKMRKWEIKLGLEAGWYERMFAKQNGLCAICGNPERTKDTRKHQEKGEKRMAIDHCHTRNIARGLLCMSCNTKLAVLEDADFVAKAQAYLGKH